MRSVRAIIERIEAGSEVIAQDMAHVRELVAGGGLWSRIAQFFIGSTRGRSRKRPTVHTED